MFLLGSGLVLLYKIWLREGHYGWPLARYPCLHPLMLNGLPRHRGAGTHIFVKVQCHPEG